MRMAVIGAGPVGLEAALQAEGAGHEVVVWEAGEVGQSVREWSHVQLFTPWSMNATEAGRAALGDPDLPDEACPTGGEFVERYLLPLASRLDVRTGHRVRAIGRGRHHKGDALGAAARAEDPFVLHVEGPEGAFLDRADAVLDCTGTWSDPVPAGIGGIEAPGEATLAAQGRIRYGPVPVGDLAGQRVLLVGNGASAATVLLDLLALDPAPAVRWLTLGEQVPGFASPEDDPLRLRRTLFERARQALERPEVQHLQGHIVGFGEGETMTVRFDDGSTLEVDATVVCAGFRPDASLHRELQFHACWGSEGPMKLAAALLANGDGGGDCLAEQASGPELLANPEPNFFVLGSKSYGRRSDFLLKTGYRQVREVLELLEG